MINPGKNHLPGMLLFLDFSKIPVGFGVPDEPIRRRRIICFYSFLK